MQELYDKLIELIKCPIQQNIINDGVIASDGQLYEKTAIDKWLLQKKTSPVTNEPINDTLIHVYSIKSIINILIEINPQLKDEQFVPEKLIHTENINDIDHCLNKKNYYALLKYQKFDLGAFINIKGENEGPFVNFLNNAPFEILSYVFNNIENLDAPMYNKNRLIHYVCESGRNDIIKYLIDKKVKFENRNQFLKKPIHYALENCNFEMIKYIFDKINVKLNDRDKSKNYPIHYLMCNKKMTSSEKIIILDKFTNLEYFNDAGYYPIHMACINADKELIKYFIDKNVNLECNDDRGYRPIHYICSNPDLTPLLPILVDRKVDINCETYVGETPLSLLAKPSTLTMLKYLIDKGAEIKNYIVTDTINNKNDVSYESDSD